MSTPTEYSQVRICNNSALEFDVIVLIHPDQILKLLSLMMLERLERSLEGGECALAALSIQLTETLLYKPALSSELTMWTGRLSHFLCSPLPIKVDIY